MGPSGDAAVVGSSGDVAVVGPSGDAADIGPTAEQEKENLAWTSSGGQQ